MTTSKMLRCMRPAQLLNKALTPKNLATSASVGPSSLKVDTRSFHTSFSEASYLDKRDEDYVDARHYGYRVCSPMSHRRFSSRVQYDEDYDEHFLHMSPSQVSTSPTYEPEIPLYSTGLLSSEEITEILESQKEWDNVLTAEPLPFHSDDHYLSEFEVMDNDWKSTAMDDMIIDGAEVSLD